MKKIEKDHLKDLIHQTGHTLKSFCEKYNLSLGTVKAWNKLTRTPGYGSAMKVCNALKAEGISCFPEFLMGRPCFPVRYEAPSSKPVEDAELAAIKDIGDFKKNNQHSVRLMIWDQKMAPIFNEGDHVGGIKLAPDAFHTAHKKVCILKEKDKEKLLRKVVVKEGAFYSCYVTRPSLVPLTELEFLAPVVFLRKKLPFAA